MDTYNTVTTRRPKFIEAIAPRPKTQTEYQRRARSIACSDALLSVEWLNATKGTASYRRVLAVRQELEDLGNMLRDSRLKPSEARKVIADAQKVGEFARLREQFRQRHNALNGVLSRYAHIPVMHYEVETSIWRFGMIPKHSRGKVIQIEDGSVTVRVSESSVIAALARLAANRELYKVRLCEYCGRKWRVSERRMDKFCSKKCREGFYKNSPDFLDRKAKNQRAYRQRIKEINERQDAYQKQRKEKRS